MPAGCWWAFYVNLFILVLVWLIDLIFSILLFLEEVICGQPLIINPLIAGGRATLRGEWPWLVAVFFAQALGLKFHCSATLISDQFVVTGNITLF